MDRWLIPLILVIVACAEPEAIDINQVGDEQYLDAGRYSIDPDGDISTTLRAEFAIDEPDWEPLAAGAAGPAGTALKFVAVDEVASAACHGTEWIPIGDTVEDLANGLAGIEDFVVTESPTRITAFGYNGYHLHMETSDIGYVSKEEEFAGCDDGYFDGYQGPIWSRYYQAPQQQAEFWALDVEGSTLLIEANWRRDTLDADVAALRRMIESIVIRP